MQFIEKVPPDAQKYECPPVEEIRGFLDSRVMGQQQAIDRIAKELVHVLSGTKADRQGPRGSVLMLGPSGVGKTETAIAVVDFLLKKSTLPLEKRDPERFLLKIDCGEFSQEHHVAMLMGSPPGYVGSKGVEGSGRGEYTRPALGVEALTAHTFELTEGEKVLVILLDEIEKAHSAIRNFLLAALDKGITKTAANEEINFRNTLFLFTSNLGNHKLAQLRSQGVSLGREQIAETRKQALIGEFRPEDISRMAGSAENAVVFDVLDRLTSEKILGLQLQRAEQGLKRSGINLEFQMTATAKDRLLDLGVNPDTGARALKSVLKDQIIQPLLHPSKKGNREALNGRIVYIDYTPDSGFSFYTTANLEKAPEVQTPPPPKPTAPEGEVLSRKKEEEVKQKIEIKASRETIARLQDLGIALDMGNLKIKFRHLDHDFALDNYIEQRFYNLDIFLSQKDGKSIIVLQFFGPKNTQARLRIDENGMPFPLSIVTPNEFGTGRHSYLWWSS